MAQQTINIGASPNDGTGTPLRTAFQYTNSNFSELYTAVGPSGNNIVVPGNATITGDLTVDTSTLKVDSANDRVGVGITSPLAKLDVRQTAAAEGLKVYVNDTGATNIINFRSYDNTLGEVTRYAVACNGVATWSNVGGVAGTAMTLNATGLGVGITSPSYRLEVRDTTDAVIALVKTGANSLRFLSTSSGGVINQVDNNPLAFYTNNTERARIDSSGNFGLGVTPSAWDTNYKALQLGYPNFISGNNGGNIIDIGVNAYFNTDWKYAASSVAATRYRQVVGVHQWFTAPSGTAGNAITWTQAMTLDASGNLLVGKTARDLINAGVEILPSGQSTNIVASSVGGFTTLEVYSTTAAAYRFYVGMNGTISATNTTISGISDARLKENVQDIDVGLGAILALKPRKFDWKAGKGKDIKGDRGFIAQEFETVFPNLIDEWKENAPEGEAPYKSVRQDLIPVLVKAIQELAAEVNALKNA